MTASLSKKEFLGDMPPNKTYKVRQSYWTVFTHPGCFLGGVVEIREARNHGATVKLSLYTVVEKEPDSPDGRRRFQYTKPAREWKGTEAREYDVYYRQGSRKTGPGENWCSCDGFARQAKCKHLEALLSLANRQPSAKPQHDGHSQAGQPHNWERRGFKSFKCRACGMRAWNSDMVDRSPAGVCGGPSYPAYVRDQAAPEKPVKSSKPKRKPADDLDDGTKAYVHEQHEWHKIKMIIHDENGGRCGAFRCGGCQVVTTDPDGHEGSACLKPQKGRQHRYTEYRVVSPGTAAAFECDGCGDRTTRPHDRTGEVCPGRKPGANPTRPARKAPEKGSRKPERPLSRSDTRKGKKSPGKGR